MNYDQYDMSVPLVSGVKPVIPFEKAFEIMLEALAPLGEDYIDILKNLKMLVISILEKLQESGQVLII